MSYTNGPWVATQRIDQSTHTEAAVWGPDGDMVAMVHGNLALNGDGLDTAKLISAAPDMLEALKALCPDGDIGDGLSSGYTLSSDSILAARAAIAKAEGGEA